MLQGRQIQRTQFQIPKTILFHHLSWTDSLCSMKKCKASSKRLVRIIANFNVNPADILLKVTPGKDYDRLLGERALPVLLPEKLLLKALRRCGNYDATRRNKISRIKGYQLAFTQDQFA